MNRFTAIKEITAFNGGDFESACRHHTKYAYLGNNIGLCNVLTKYKIYVDTRDAGVTPHLIMDGFWETWMTQCLASIIEPGNVCLDIGANFGYYSLLMAELCGVEGKTIAVEPNSHICSLLRQTQCMHAYRFEVVETAISNENGNATLFIPDVYPGGASINKLHPTDNIHESKVTTTTIDEMVKKLGLTKVDVVKIDVEGAEPMVFDGMQKTLQQNPHIKILMEYSPFLYPDARKFTEYLFSRFVVHRIKDVDTLTTLDETAIEQLLQLTDHTDLYLEGNLIN